VSVQILHGDSREQLPLLAADSIDACVTDPPYALTANKKGGSGVASINLESPYGRARIGTGNGAGGFMGKQWDTGETAFDPAFWREVYRVLKPGAHLIAFGGTRTYHRLVCAIEDAGFEIRDQIAWHFGSGFPKSHAVDKAIDREAGKEGERIATGASVKRMIPGADQNKAGWEKTNGRVFEPHSYTPATPEAQQWQGWGSALKPAFEPIVLARKPLIGTIAANVLKHGTGALNIDACRVESGGLHGSASSAGLGAGRDTANVNGNAYGKQLGGVISQPHPLGRWPANVIHDGSPEVLAGFPQSDGQQRAVGPHNGAKASVNTYGDYGPREQFEPRGDSGSAARFFYTPKADKLDRLQSKHPTVKPIDLMAYLIKLVTPSGGTVLDPFAGSGSTGMAAMREGFNAILIEREAEYVADIKRRIAHVHGEDTPLFATERP